MTALLPVGDGLVTIEIRGNAIHPRLSGKDTSVRDHRLAHGRGFRAGCSQANVGWIASITSAALSDHGQGDSTRRLGQRVAAAIKPPAASPPTTLNTLNTSPQDAVVGAALVDEPLHIVL
jgi:hypothetical protein